MVLDHFKITIGINSAKSPYIYTIIPIDMKKLILLVFTFSFLAANAHIEPPKTKKEKANAEANYARAKAACIKESILYSISSENKETKVIHAFFDEEGREKTLMLYDKMGELSSIVAQTYDKHGNLVLDADRTPKGIMQEMNILHYDDDGLIWNIISYDSAWNISGSLSYEMMPETNEVYLTKNNDMHALQYTITYHYNKGLDEGDCSGIVQTDADGKLMIRVENLFDDNGQRSRKIVYGNDGSLNFTYHYTYNESGDFSEIRKIGSDGNLQRTDVYKYNDKGFVNAVKVLDAEGKVIANRRYDYVFRD